MVVGTAEEGTQTAVRVQHGHLVPAVDCGIRAFLVQRQPDQREAAHGQRRPVEPVPERFLRLGGRASGICAAVITPIRTQYEIGGHGREHDRDGTVSPPPPAGAPARLLDQRLYLLDLVELARPRPRKRSCDNQRHLRERS